jgi:hypothetical protein
MAYCSSIEKEAEEINCLSSDTYSFQPIELISDNKLDSPNTICISNSLTEA